jgi:hypothetical protein
MVRHVERKTISACTKNLLHSLHYHTLPSQWFLATARLRVVSTTAPHDANTDVSSKEGAVIAKHSSGSALTSGSTDFRHRNK